MKLTIPYLLLSLLAWVYASEVEVKNGLISNEHLADKRAASSLESTDDMDIDVHEVAHRRAEPFSAPYRVNSNNEPLRASYKRRHGKHPSRNPPWFRNRGKWRIGGPRNLNEEPLNLGENVHVLPVEHTHVLPPHIIEPAAHPHNIPSLSIEHAELTHGSSRHTSDGHPHGIGGPSHEHLPDLGVQVPSTYRIKKKKPFGQRQRIPIFGLNNAIPNWQRSSIGSRFRSEFAQILSEKQIKHGGSLLGGGPGQNRNRFRYRHFRKPIGRHHNRGRNRPDNKNRVFSRYRHPSIATYQW